MSPDRFFPFSTTTNKVGLRTRRCADCVFQDSAAVQGAVAIKYSLSIREWIDVLMQGHARLGLASYYSYIHVCVGRGSYS